MLNSSTTFQFELVSPERKLIAEPATMAVIPGSEGYFGVLPNHTSLVAALRPGVLEVYTQGHEQPRRIFIAGGFADVSAANCTVLAEEAINVADLNQPALEQTLRNLRADLGLADEAFEKARLEQAIILTQAKLEAFTGHVVS